MNNTRAYWNDILDIKKIENQRKFITPSARDSFSNGYISPSWINHSTKKYWFMSEWWVEWMSRALDSWVEHSTHWVEHSTHGTRIRLNVLPGPVAESLKSVTKNKIGRTITWNQHSQQPNNTNSDITNTGITNSDIINTDTKRPQLPNSNNNGHG